MEASEDSTISQLDVTDVAISDGQRVEDLMHRLDVLRATASETVLDHLLVHVDEAVQLRRDALQRCESDPVRPELHEKALELVDAVISGELAGEMGEDPVDGPEESDTTTTFLEIMISTT